MMGSYIYKMETTLTPLGTTSTAMVKMRTVVGTTIKVFTSLASLVTRHSKTQAKKKS